MSDLRDQAIADLSKQVAMLTEKLGAQVFEVQHLRGMFTEERLRHLGTMAELKEVKDAAEVNKAGRDMNTEKMAHPASNRFSTFTGVAAKTDSSEQANTDTGSAAPAA